MWLFSTKGPSGVHPQQSNLHKGIDGSGLTAIVTGSCCYGGSSGIGAETARALALCGVHVVMGVRSMVAGVEVKQTIVEENPAAKI